MVVLEAIGLASKEMFDYNRENFSFDNEQRLDKEKTRLLMQVERFQLFREDIEDLVDLTVSKMDMYHAVAALLLGSAATLYTEGRMHVPGNTPPWYIAIYFISIAGTFCYLLLAVWLSMYASVSSHSFGVRLRTRYVRLPIPTLAELQSLTAKLQNFEKQGVTNILRVPFSSEAGPDWKLEAEQEAFRAQGAASSSTGPAPVPTGSGASGSRSPPAPPGRSAIDDWLGNGEAAFGKHAIVDNAAAAPGQHVQLFRRLQARWQCYDAYARVSMSIGINQLLQTLTYYLLGCTLIENQSPSTALSLTLIYQAAAVFVLYMDVAGVSHVIVCAIQLIGTMPATIVLVALFLGEREESGLLRPDNKYTFSPIAFFFELIWFEALLWIASPSKDDEAALPRRFRSVLFLDVFGDAHYDPTEAEQVLPAHDPDPHSKERRRHRRMEEQTANAERYVLAALSAVRRWEAVPGDLMSVSVLKSLRKCRQDFEVWRRAFAGFTVQQKCKRGVAAHDLAMIEEDVTRTWAELTVQEQEADPFAEFLLGPFDVEGGTVYYDLEAGQTLYDDFEGREILTLKDVQNLVRRAEMVVQDTLTGEDTEPDSDAEAPVAKGRSLQRGESGLPTKVERLPWKALRRLTRCFQVCWLFLGIMDILYVQGFDFDHIRWQQQDEVEEKEGLIHSGHARRLAQEEPPLIFLPLSVKWPHGSFFQPTLLSWRANSSEAPGGLLVGSPFRTYQVEDLDSSQLRFAVLPWTSFPPGSTLACAGGGPGAPACLSVALGPDGLQVWPSGEPRQADRSAALRFGGEAWSMAAGALLQCARVPRLLPLVQSDAEWCLVLAGWGGSRLPVVALPLRVAATGAPAMPTDGETVVPRLDAPLRPPRSVAAEACSPASARVTAKKSGTCAVTKVLSIAGLHIEASSGRLWALHTNGDVEAWDLPALRRLGRLRSTRPAVGPSSSSALLEVPGRAQLLVAGLELSGPALLTARLPPRFLVQAGVGLADNDSFSQDVDFLV